MNIQKILKTPNAILINTVLPDLRTRQYFNAMCELKSELIKLSTINTIDAATHKKIAASQKRITDLVDKMKKKHGF